MRRVNPLQAFVEGEHALGVDEAIEMAEGQLAMPAVARVTLANGARVEVRAVEPTDTSLHEELLEHLSPDSRYRRFLTHMEPLNARQLSNLTTLDHDRQEALVAIDAVIGEAVAVARYAAIIDEPGTAEIAIAVSDPWQRRGLGTMLLNRLAERSRPRHPPLQRRDAVGQQRDTEAHDLARAGYLTHGARGHRRTGRERRLGAQR